MTKHSISSKYVYFLFLSSGAAQDPLPRFYRLSFERSGREGACYLTSRRKRRTRRAWRVHC